MISIQVSYKVQPEFVQQNIKNISTFLSDFKKLSNANFLYNVYLKEDGLTFSHISMYETEEAQKAVLSVPSFIQFQQERDNHGMVESPKIENINLIGSSLSLM